MSSKSKISLLASGFPILNPTPPGTIPLRGRKDVYKHWALRLGLVGTRSTGALALMAQQHEVVHVIYCQSLTGALREIMLLNSPFSVVCL